MRFDPELRGLLYKLIENSDQTVYDLMFYTNKPKTTIYDNLDPLEKVGLIKKARIRDGGIGRPITIWKVTKKLR